MDEHMTLLGCVVQILALSELQFTPQLELYVLKVLPRWC